LGLWGIVGVFIFVTFFGMRPADPPGDIMLIILCVVILLATLEAAGGLDYLVGIAEKIVRKHPKRITVIAPAVSFVLCAWCTAANTAAISETASSPEYQPLNTSGFIN
jgi:anaerobic C4-dicarboxylate transporter DcuA